MKTNLILFLILNASLSIATTKDELKNNFCTVETRLCHLGDLRGGRKVHCGYHYEMAFINCGEGDNFKIFAKKGSENILSKTKKEMAKRDMKLHSVLNKKEIYISSKRRDIKKICYAEAKYTQRASNFFKNQSLEAEGYTIDCSDSSVRENLRLIDLSDTTIENHPIKKVLKSLFNIMSEQNYKFSQWLPLNRKEKNDFPFDPKGMMFTDNDYRFSGIIFF
jgi:hypothetical protein